MKTNNYIFPFFWVHGESEEVYRDTIRAIDEANIKAFCVEARPHEGFCRDEWWHDMDIILDEAEKRGMQVWILDDKHFPTGYANGGAEYAPAALRRQSIFCKVFPVEDTGPVLLNLEEICHPELSEIQKAMDQYLGNDAIHNQFDDDRFLSAVAIRVDGERTGNHPIPLSEYVSNNVLSWQAPEGRWQVLICFLSRNAGAHRSYINMMDRESCRIQIDQVYEPHYARYKDKFGTVIAGFFSDEPELGNGFLYQQYNPLGTEQDLPWSRELEAWLQQEQGRKYSEELSLLWSNDCDEAQTARIRYAYMNAVTRLVEEDFSRQIGEWCRERGVDYIGHVVEDNNQHSKTSCSLGHFYRGMKYQSMAGIDDIGGQVYPQGEDVVRPAIWDYPTDPEFYHFALGKLGASMGELIPHMKGRSMCEIFGNYGWAEGVRLEKYLVDHFMVRGINHFVPHAFSCKAYPDPDCPPHFYAHGNDPQYRHFGKLMAYTNRVLTLLDGADRQVPVAILYHAEAEWCGKFMEMQKPARVLAECQVDFRFVPGDAFEEPEFYRTELGTELVVNGKKHSLLIVPYSQYLPGKVLAGIEELQHAGCPVWFLGGLPEGSCQGDKLSEQMQAATIKQLAELPAALEAIVPGKSQIVPQNARIRLAWYRRDDVHILYVFNEYAGIYRGKVSLPWEEEDLVWIYDAWAETVCPAVCQIEDARAQVEICLKPSESCMILGGGSVEGWVQMLGAGEKEKQALTAGSSAAIVLEHFDVSTCRSMDYPAFVSCGKAMSGHSYAETDPSFSGFLRYETTFGLSDLLTTGGRVWLEITDAGEAVEVFVNGQSSGLEILPPFYYDLTGLCHEGLNQLQIEVATTLERENADAPEKLAEAAPTGLFGQVRLYFIQN